MAMTATERRLFDDAVSVCRMVAAASMGTTSSNGESSIGWQPGDLATADIVKTAARKVVAGVGK